MSSRELMVKVARMSHESHMKNQEIADQLFQEKLLPSRNAKKVQEIIDEAGAWLLQEHERLAALEHAETTERQLAASLCDKYGLLDARVVSGGETQTPPEYAALLRKYGRVAADYFDEIASAAEDEGEKLHVGVGGGQTVLDFVSSLDERKRPNVSYYALALIGRGSQTTMSHVGPETNTTIAWSRSGRLPRHLFYGTVQPFAIGPADFRDLNRKERHNYARELIDKQLNDLKEQDNIRSILEDMNKYINMAIAGVGLVQPTGIDAEHGGSHVERLAMTGLLKPLGIDLELLTQEGAFGELCYSLFDAKGSGDPRWRFFLSAGDGSKHSGVDFYRHLVEERRRVIVCAGPRKEEQIRTALSAKLFNVLITDAYTANRLLKA